MRAMVGASARSVWMNLRKNVRSGSTAWERARPRTSSVSPPDASALRVTMPRGIHPSCRSASLDPANRRRVLALEISFGLGMRKVLGDGELELRLLPRADVLQEEDAGGLDDVGAAGVVAFGHEERLSGREDVRAGGGPIERVRLAVELEDEFVPALRDLHRL